LNDSDINKKLDSVDKKAGGVGLIFGEMIGTVVKVGAAIGAAAVAAGGALFTLAKNTSDVASEINDMSERTGLSTDRLQELKYASRLVGVEFDSITGVVKILTNNMDSASEGSKAQSAAFKELHVKVKGVDGQLRDMDDIFPEVINKLADMQNETKRNALAADIFGKSANELVPLLNQGSEGIKKFTDEAHKYGAVMSKEAIEAGDKFGDSLDILKMSFSGIISQIGSEVIPVFQKMADTLIKNMPEIKRTIGEVIERYVKPAFEGLWKAIIFVKDALNFLMPVIVGTGAAFLAFNIITKGALIIEALTKAWRVATAVLALYRAGASLATIAQLILNGAMAVNPFVIAAIAIGVLVAAIYLLWKNWDAISAAFVKSWNWIKDTAVNIFNGIKDFFVGIFTKIYDTATNIINSIVGFFNGIFNFFENVINTIKSAFSWLTGWNNTTLQSKDITNTITERRAKGGSVSTGNPYFVGENGPELFIPNASGKITPNNKLGGNTFILNVKTDNPADMRQAQKYGQAIVDFLRARGVNPA
jgi:phage-related protein